MPANRKSPRTDGWSACKRVLKDWPRPGVVALVQELYRLSDENRRFLHGRLLSTAGQTNEAAVADTIKAVRRLMTPSAIWNGRFRHVDVKRIIDRFAKAVDNDPAALGEVLLADLDAACQTLGDAGDYEPLVDHIYATMERLDECLQLLSPDAATPLVARLGGIASRWGASFGWGVSDELAGMAEYWREKLEPNR